MFGPGMEELDVSLVTRLMHAPDMLPISGISHRQINGENHSSIIIKITLSVLNVGLGTIYDANHPDIVY